jgi:hypothetical protein
LEENKLSAINPQTFSHLSSLDDLDLSENSCINKRFENNPRIGAELAFCGIGYTLQEQQNLEKTRFEETDKKIDGKFEELKTLLERNQETCEKKIEMFSQKLETFGKSIQTNNGNLEIRFEEMEKKIGEIERMMKEMLSMMTVKQV